MRSSRVLVMDDRFFGGLALSEHLESVGYTVQGPHMAAPGVREVVAVTHPNFAVLQVQARPEAALELCRELVGKGIRVMVVGEDPSLLSRASEIGAVAVAGPVTPRTIVRHLAAMARTRPSPEPA